MKNSNIFDKVVPVFLVLLILVYPLIFVFIGGDLTDAGYHAVNYTYFNEMLFEGNPNVYKTLLTNIIGNAWMFLFPNLGLFGLKILWLAFFYASIFMLFLILNPLIKNYNYLLFFILTAEIFGTRLTNFIFNYDICSWFFLTFTVYFSIAGLNKNKYSFFILAAA